MILHMIYLCFYFNVIFFYTSHTSHLCFYFLYAIFTKFVSFGIFLRVLFLKCDLILLICFYFFLLHMIPFHMFIFYLKNMVFFYWHVSSHTVHFAHAHVIIVQIIMYEM